MGPAMTPDDARRLLQAAGLPARWAGRERFVLLAVGGQADALLAALRQAWEDDAQRCRRLQVVLLLTEAQPVTAADAPSVPGLQRLPAPPLADGSAMTLDLLRPPSLLAGHGAHEALREGLRALRLQADALLLAGTGWDEHLLRRLGSLAAPQATLAAFTPQGLPAGLQAAGFSLQAGTPPQPQARTTAWLQADFAPRFVPRPEAATGPAAQPGDEVLVLGAGLAGATCAQALARAGLRVTVLERHALPAQQASGNPGGLFHGIVNAQDGLHARFNRAAALLAARRYRSLIESTIVPGAIDGLLRLQPDGPGAAQMQGLADALGLPADYVQAVDAATAAALAGLPLEVPAWFYPAGGWLNPRALVAHCLAQPGITLRTGVAVARLQQAEDGRWQALDGEGQVLAQASQVVLCAAHDTLALLPPACTADWKLGRQRGQLTVLPAGTPGLRRPLRPVAGGGYVLPLPDGAVLCGATAQPGDDDAGLRAQDQAANLARYAALTGAEPPPADTPLPGRTAFRLLADDRLPLVGPVPQPGARHEQPRRIARLPGLLVCTALGSRGITWAPLAAELLTAWVTGGPPPLEADLVDALDPARFVARRARKSTG